MRAQVEDALRSLTVGELVEARGFIDDLLSQLQDSGEAARGQPPGGLERRRFGRYAFDLSVTYVRHRASGASRLPRLDLGEATVQDISRGGIGFSTAEPLKVDEVLTVYLPGPMGVRKLYVEVLRVQLCGNRYECGAAFVGLDRVLAVQRTEPEVDDDVLVVLACELGAERDALANLLARSGYGVRPANSVPEACSILTECARCLLVATAPMMLGEGSKLLEASAARPNEVLSIAIVSTSEVDRPENTALASCADFIGDPTHAREVAVVVGRTCHRLAVASSRASDEQPQ